MIKSIEKIDEKTVKIITDKKEITLKINEEYEKYHKNTKMKKCKGFFKNIEYFIKIL